MRYRKDKPIVRLSNSDIDEYLIEEMIGSMKDLMKKSNLDYSFYFENHLCFYSKKAGEENISCLFHIKDEKLTPSQIDYILGFIFTDFEVCSLGIVHNLVGNQVNYRLNTIEGIRSFWEQHPHKFSYI